MSIKNSEQYGMIQEDFFAKDIKIDIKNIFPMLVIATMSSGKSTLINALLSQQILPSKNAACTAKIYYILDDDQNTEPVLYIKETDGKTVVKNKNIREELRLANDDSNVADIFIKGQVKGVLNTDKSLLLVDTPGPNNSRNLLHSEITRGILDKVTGGLILYVMDATQIGIDDDRELLRIVSGRIKECPKLKVLFAVNKVDQLDEEMGESIEKFMMTVKEYLELCGFDKPSIIPVCALAANIFKKILNREELTRKEYRDFEYYYDLYMPKGFDMRSYVITEGISEQSESICVRDKEYKVRSITAAIENTGIKILEEKIQEAQILSSRK